jgi:hypothetical protein
MMPFHSRCIVIEAGTYFHNLTCIFVVWNAADSHVRGTWFY